MTDLAIGQVAFNHLAGSRLWEWYRDGLLLVPSGATLFGGPPAAKVNGLPAPLFSGHWLMDGQDRSQCCVTLGGNATGEVPSEQVVEHRAFPRGSAADNGRNRQQLMAGRT